MLPPKTDPKWQRLTTNTSSIPVTNLVTQMLLTRLRIMNFEKSEARKQEVIDAAYDFFVKNESMVKSDIKLIFG
jgi:hypothetical protein